MIEQNGIIANKQTGENISQDTLQKKVNFPEKETRVRELRSDEFPAADKCWVEYHDTSSSL
jgi:hypothetical protein